MKKLFYLLLTILPAMLFIAACNKSGDLAVLKKPAASNTLVTKGDSSKLDSVRKPVTYDTTSFKGDQITLVPHFYTTSGDSSSVYFIAQTKNKYCGISKMAITSSLVNNSYSVGFINVVQPSPCVIGQGPIGQAVTFTQTQSTLLAVGTFPLKVTLNGITYTGSIIATATTLTFNWDYTEGVLISPKQVNKYQ